MKVKLIDFDGRGISEPIRLILAYGGKEFEDVRIPMTIPPKTPPEIKAKSRWGSLPIAEFDEEKLCQSLAITRYFAKKNNLVPNDDFQAALCDEYVDACRDFIIPWISVYMEEDEDKRQEMFAEVAKTSKERFLSVFESTIEANGGKHLVGNALTWADIYLAHFISDIKLSVGKCCLNDEFPAIKKLIENVVNTPGIREWIDKRPNTKF